MEAAEEAASALGSIAPGPHLLASGQAPPISQIPARIEDVWDTPAKLLHQDVLTNDAHTRFSPTAMPTGWALTGLDHGIRECTRAIRSDLATQAKSIRPATTKKVGDDEQNGRAAWCARPFL